MKYIKYIIMLLISLVIIPIAIVDCLIMCLSMVFLFIRNEDIKTYIKNNFIAIDQRVNTLILGGFPDETISSRLGKLQRRNCKVAKFICKILDFFDKGHCEKSIEEDEGYKIIK